jgi:hypothetical protein
MIRPPCNGGGAMPFRAKNHNSNPLSSTKQAGLALRRVSFIFTNSREVNADVVNAGGESAVVARDAGAAGEGTR